MCEILLGTQVFFFSLCLLGKLHRHVSRKIPNSVHIPSLCFVCIRLCSNSLLGSDFNVLDCYCLSWCCTCSIIKEHFLKLAKRLQNFTYKTRKKTTFQMTQELRDDNLKGWIIWALLTRWKRWHRTQAFCKCMLHTLDDGF